MLFQEMLGEIESIEQTVLEGAQVWNDDQNDMDRKMVELVGFIIPDIALSKGGSCWTPRAAQDMMSEFPYNKILV